MTSLTADVDRTATRLEWQMNVAASVPSNYDGRVTVNAKDIRALIAALTPEDDISPPHFCHPFCKSDCPNGPDATEAGK